MDIRPPIPASAINYQLMRLLQFHISLHSLPGFDNTAGARYCTPIPAFANYNYYPK